MPTIVREHVPLERVQTDGLGKESDPVPPDCEKVTVPAGVEPPDTVAVQSVDPPIRKDEGAQETPVEGRTCR